jgi:hypothetical protein
VGNDIELDCGGYHVKTASVAQSSGGTVFRCTLSDIPNEVLAALEKAARAHGKLRLIFPKQPLVLERIDVRRIEPHSVQIVGRVVESP